MSCKLDGGLLYYGDVSPTILHDFGMSLTLRRSNLSVTTFTICLQACLPPARPKIPLIQPSFFFVCLLGTKLRLLAVADTAEHGWPPGQNSTHQHLL